MPVQTKDLPQPRVAEISASGAPEPVYIEGVEQEFIKGVANQAGQAINQQYPVEKAMPAPLKIPQIEIQGVKMPKPYNYKIGQQEQQPSMLKGVASALDPLKRDVAHLTSESTTPGGNSAIYTADSGSSLQVELQRASKMAARRGGKAVIKK